MSLSRKALRKALIASFSVYLLPLAAAHIVLVWGWAVFVEFFAGRGNREPLWLAADTVLAVALQGSAFILFAWIFFFGPRVALIAASTSTNLNIGNIKDSLFVLRTRDGAEVYRHYFRQYTRTRMAFLGPRHLAVTRADLEKGGGWVEVLAIPEAVAGP